MPSEVMKEAYGADDDNSDDDLERTNDSESDYGKTDTASDIENTYGPPDTTFDEDNESVVENSPRTWMMNCDATCHSKNP
ncbi:hypothetical protein LTR24_009727 [Lithohypha guttulata]|uniref:Uncharacterized protein n=1 Tax=Lithohypha guttulata TaxID=1690604 RepID=A0ABR0JW35_9EURO|nr:hypothetical protein LTR24_009727 [Lithohypha guttulata]